MSEHNPVLRGPLPGPYLEYLTRIIRIRRPGDPAGTLGVETVYCKDSVAKFLKLKLAPPRDGVFGAGMGNTNAGATFAKRADKGSNFYKILLLPFTKIRVLRRNPQTGVKNEEDFIRSTLGISINGRVGVATVRQWLMYQIGGAGNTEVRKLIKGLITPSLKTYTWRSELSESEEPPLPINPIPFYEGNFEPLPEAQLPAANNNNNNANP